MIGAVPETVGEEIAFEMISRSRLTKAQEIWTKVVHGIDWDCVCGRCGKESGRAACNRTPLIRMINTMYKPKSRKVQPVDDHPSDGSVPDGDPEWKKKKWKTAKESLQYGHRFDKYVCPKFSDIPAGSRLTPERLGTLLQGCTPDLTDEERELFTHILFAREAALAWDFTECGRIDADVVPPQVIRTIPHSAWQEKSIPIPRPLLGKVVELLRQRIERGILEQSHGAYRNPWFLVQKKDGGLRLINNATRYNKVTIRDACIPPDADAIAEEFAACAILSLLDLFSGYDQVELDLLSRDLTTFHTPIGLLRMCTLPQGATNSVGQFVRAITRVLYDLIPHICQAFVDDICVKGPIDRYSDQEVEPGIRKFVLEHLQNISSVLVNCELAGATIAAGKSQWCRNTAVLLGYICGTNGRLPDQAKVIKITEWGPCKDVKDVRVFLGMIIYYRLWIDHYAIIALPLIELLRKGKKFQWGYRQSNAMASLKKALTTPPILIVLDYGENGGEIILMVDASLLGWGAGLMQIRNGKRMPSRYESGIWSDAESRYDATKRECRGLLCALRRMRRQLFGCQFVIETDANVLVYQINGAADDLPGAVLMRWIAWIRLFDFTIRHVPGSKNVVADALSRRGPGPSDALDQETEENIDDFVDTQIHYQELIRDAQSIEVARTFTQELNEGPLLEGSWSEESWTIANFLATLSDPPSLSGKALRNWKARVMQHYVLQNKILWKRPDAKNPTKRRVVDSDQERKLIWDRCHGELGHKGRFATYERIRKLYWWQGMYRDVSEWTRSCEPCQKALTKRFEDPARYTSPPLQPFVKWHLDLQRLPPDQGCTYLAEARCAFTGYVVTKPLKRAAARKIRSWLFEDVFLVHGYPLEVTVDGGPENKGELRDMLLSFKIRRVVISSYNSPANGISEQGHVPIAQMLLKMLDGKSTKWVALVPAVTMADRTAVRRMHGYSPYFLTHGYDPILPIELDVPTWRVLEWESIDVSDQDAWLKLIRLRTEMFASKADAISKAAELVRHARKQQAEYRDERNRGRMRPKNAQLSEGDLVLATDQLRLIDKSVNRKLQYRWQGPFRIRKIEKQGTYHLQQLDGVWKAGTYPAWRLKKFVRTAEGVLLAADGDDAIRPDGSDPTHPNPTGPEEPQYREEDVIDDLPGSQLDQNSHQEITTSDRQGTEQVQEKGPPVDSILTGNPEEDTDDSSSASSASSVEDLYREKPRTRADMGRLAFEREKGQRLVVEIPRGRHLIRDPENEVAHSDGE